MHKSIFLTISLERTPERWEAFRTRFVQEMGFSPQCLNAVDGVKLPESRLQALQSVESSSIVARELSRGEIACYLSHLKACETLLESESEWALVMEDDVFFIEGARDWMSNPDWIPEGVDIVQVASYKPEAEKCYVLPAARKVLAQGSELIQMMDPVSYGTQAYWINRKAAQALLDLPEPLVGPIDHVLFDQTWVYAKALNVYTLSPFVAYQDFDPSKSLIEQERWAGKTFEAKRPSWWERKVVKRFRKYKTFQAYKRTALHD